MISSSQRPLPDNTQQSKQKNIHAPGGIRTHNLSMQAAADLLLGRAATETGINYLLKKKVKWSRYRPGVTQRVGRGIALLFHDCGTRTRWVVSSTPRPHFTPGKDPVPILQEAGWAPVLTGGKSRPHRDSIPDRPARSQSPYRLSYRAHINYLLLLINSHSSTMSYCCRSHNCCVMNRWIKTCVQYKPSEE